MPANLPPQYYEMEKKLREAKTPEDKIDIIEELLAIMPKHKGTDHLKAELRNKIAKLSQQATKSSSTRHTSMTIPREGAAQVAVVGLTSVGKSQLVSRITNASPMVADYPFATQEATPGMMKFENIQIQLIDTPPLAPQVMPFWLPHLIRRADALLIMVDLSSDPGLQLEETISQLHEMKAGLLGVDVSPAEGTITVIKVLVAANKADLPGAEERYAALQEEFGDKLPMIAISAKEGIGLAELRKKIFEILNIVRVYTKAPGQKAELSEPFTLSKGTTVEEAAEAVHKDFRTKLKYARVWGSGKHDGVMVKRDHILQDGDIIELHA